MRLGNANTRNAIFVFALLSPFTILAYQTSHRPFIQRTII